jgi:hypothetical protein
MTTKENSIVNSKLLEKFTLEYLKEHEELINFVKKETEKQLRIGGVVGQSEQLCDHPIDKRADIFNSRQTYCLKCKTFL